MIYFAGAGCGAADLITVRGMKLLEKADVVIYAGSLVNPELLSYTKEACEIYNSATMTLEEVIEVMRKAESESKMVVRLHTGEPSLYGAVREQMDCLDELGISYESCPGVSAALVQLHLCRSNIHCRRSHRALLLPAWQEKHRCRKKRVSRVLQHIRHPWRST